MKTLANLSIVIPTLEEERYLPLLLDSIKRQNLNCGYEIIIADAGSKDKTVEIAKSYGCKVVKGGLPAKGRNEGAKIAKGDLILFVDADIIFEKDSLGQLIKEFKSRKLDSAGFLLKPCDKSVLSKLLYDIFYNIPTVMMEKFLPHLPGAILIRKSFLDKIGGFDERVKLGEDIIYAEKAFRHGRFGVLKSFKINYSERRYKRDGFVKTYLVYFLARLQLWCCGSIKSDILRYDIQTRRFQD